MKTMSKLYTISFDRELGIIIVRVFGMATHDDHFAARDEAIKLCHKEHCSKLLVDLRKLNTQYSSTMDCFSFGKSVSSLYPGLIVAHVLPYETKSKKDVKFTSTVETNRGITSKEFEDIDKAKNWLFVK